MTLNDFRRRLFRDYPDLNYKKLYKEQRKLLGIGGTLLPILVFFYSVFANKFNILHSISQTYYWNCNIFLILLLGSIGLFFLTYSSRNLADKILTRLEGVFGLMIVLFPCADTVANKVGLFNLPKSILGTIHGVSAFLFFILLFLQILFIFPQKQPSDENNKQKDKRNLVYKICGIIMGIAIVVTPIGLLFKLDRYFTHFIWFQETVLILSFGIAYLVKGGAIELLNDK
jgi:hypothetical protein